LTLLRLDTTCSDTPFVMRTSLQTHLNDDYYCLRRQSDAGDGDRSLTTSSLLDEPIALQTSESTVAGGAPIIAIGAR
jgi:hypothetical protein